MILDRTTTLCNLTGSRLETVVDRLRRDFDSKRLKREYVTSLDPPAPSRNLVVFSTELSPAFNAWENVKIFTARALRLARDMGLDRVAILLNTDDAVAFMGKVVEGAILGAYTFDKYKKEKASDSEKRLRLDLVTLKSHDAQNRHYLDRYTLVSQAVNQARDLINEPGSAVIPETLAETARRFARESNLSFRVWDEKRLQKAGYSGLIQVGKGSVHPPRLIRLSYRARKSTKHLVFVGKGVTFDTGGISLKPPEKMFEMKGDMAGAAAVLCAMKAIGRLKPDVHVTGIVPAAENFPGSHAQLPGDIFRAKNGKTVMVDNTDAEGRLILTDGLYLAGEEKATHVLDIATLTGSCVRALGYSVAGIMGNDPSFIRAVIASGQNHGESFWELPLPEEYKEMLKTPYADLNNVGGSVAGVLTAGLFLKEFVPENTSWAHLDIAGPFMRDKEWKYYEAGAIGFGAKTLVDLAERFGEYFPATSG